MDEKKTIIHCVACAQRLRVPVDRGLLEVRCPNCRATWQWEFLEAPGNDDVCWRDAYPLGSHLVTPRAGYSHHGIYVGDDRVIHYAGFADGPNTGPVEETDLWRFAAGQDFYIKHHPAPAFTGQQVVERANARLGEDLYSLFANNCEHFCEWAINDAHLSRQIDAGTTLAGSGAGAAVGIAARVVVAASGSVAGLSGAGIMSGLATVGGVVGGGAVAGIGLLGAIPAMAGASLINSTVLADNPAHSEEERGSRSMGRVASYVGGLGGTAGSIGVISAAGTAGLSGAGITSGLAAVGSVVGGGMASGVVIATAAPVVVAAAAGYGLYKLVRMVRR